MHLYSVSTILHITLEQSIIENSIPMPTTNIAAPTIAAPTATPATAITPDLFIVRLKIPLESALVAKI